MAKLGCERCGGSMFIEEEGRFRDVVCLQCGYRPKDGEQLVDRLQMLRARRRAA